jgi:teichuronic acid biosynthesis glycosyltransferase TuaC
MRVYVLHTGNAINIEKFDETIHLKMNSIYDGVERSFYKKELINAYSQMNSIRDQNIDIQYGIIDHKSSITHFIRSGKNLRKEVLNHSCELVHVTWGTFSALLAVLYSPVPVVISFCGSDILGGYGLNGKRALKSNISILLSQLAAFGAKRIISKSNKIKKAIWSLNRAKATVIPNGVNTSAFYPMDRTTARKHLAWNPEQPIVLFFSVKGQIVKNKPLADETIQLLKQQLSDVEMRVIENIPHQELIYYYNAADVMLLTSFHEGSNNSVKEALACNLPVVSVNCGDTADRLKDVKPSAVVGSYQASLLARELFKILSDRQRSNGQSVINEIREPMIAKQIVQTYKEALNK